MLCCNQRTMIYKTHFHVLRGIKSLTLNQLKWKWSRRPSDCSGNRHWDQTLYMHSTYLNQPFRKNTVFVNEGQFKRHIRQTSFKFCIAANDKMLCASSLSENRTVTLRQGWVSVPKQHCCWTEMLLLNRVLQHCQRGLSPDGGHLNTECNIVSGV